MTERGQPIGDGSSACPFVAFADDRDARAEQPDDRHRCFAEPQPSPRAFAHQEAYCLSSAFPVCPTFQTWARREAAHAKAEDERAAGPPIADTGATTFPATAPLWDLADDRSAAAAGPSDAVPPQLAERPVPGPVEPVEPVETTPRRNALRSWAAPPPWAGGPASGSSGAGPRPRSPVVAEPSGPRQTGAGQGLVGSPADRFASGDDAVFLAAPENPLVTRPESDTGEDAQDVPSTGPDADLAQLVGGGAVGSDESDDSASAPRAIRVGARRTVSSTRPGDHDRQRDRAGVTPPQHVQGAPAWERARRHEAYPVIKTRSATSGMPGFAGLSRLVGLALLLGLAAVALFFLPGILGVGEGSSTSTSRPTASRDVSSASVAPTAIPAPTPTTYTIKDGDTLSKVARKFGLKLDELLAANTTTITNPDKIAVGDVILIPTPVPNGVSGSAKPSRTPSASP